MCARISEALPALAACASLALLCACAHAPVDPRERLAQYRANAGGPVASIEYVRNMRWQALGDQAMAVWPRRDSGFLVEFASPCPGLGEARSIQITRAEGRVRARQDAVRVVSLAGAPPMQRAPCPILLIRPIGEPAGDMPDGLRGLDPSEGTAP